MQITYLGNNSTFLNNAFFNSAYDVTLSIVSQSETRVELRNESTGVTTVLSGTGLAFNEDATPRSGTITSMSMTQGSSATPLGGLEQITWSATSFFSALQALETNNRAPLAALFNSNGAIIVDANAATDDINFEDFFADFLPLITQRLVYHDSRFDDTILGTNQNDVILIGSQTGNTFHEVEATAGDDVINFTNTNSGTFTFLDYDLDFVTKAGGISVKINQGANTGTIAGPGFTDTLTDVNKVLTSIGGGLSIGASAKADTFDIQLASGGSLELLPGEGNDALTIALNGGLLRLNYFYGALVRPSTGLVANLADGVISNDGFGTRDTLTFTNSSGGLELRGTDFNDAITGSNRNESFILEQGNDTVDGGGGIDQVRYNRSGVGDIFVDLATGKATGKWDGKSFTHTLSSIEVVRGSVTGNDTLRGAALNDTLFGRGGNDSLNGRDGNDKLFGDDGDDKILGEKGADSLEGGLGNDSLYGGDGNDTLKGGANQDLVVGGNGNDVIFGDSANDTLYGNDGADSLYGGSGNDKLSGGNHDDSLRGESGNDTLTGASGNDTLAGGDGDNYLDGGTGNDKLYGGSGIDNIIGGSGNDLLAGSGGADSLNGGLGDDTLYGNDQNDTIDGDDGADYMSGGSGNDLLFGREGQDTVRGSSGNDRLFGGADNDVMAGNRGHDTIEGGSGDDRLFGGGDNDRLIGGGGRDVMGGGSGADVFVFNSIDDSRHGSNRDIIRDFVHNFDKIDLSGIASNLNFVSSYTGTAGEVRYNQSIGRLYVDIDGDQASDFSVALLNKPVIDADDLIL